MLRTTLDVTIQCLQSVVGRRLLHTDRMHMVHFTLNLAERHALKECVAQRMCGCLYSIHRVNVLFLFSIRAAASLQLFTTLLAAFTGSTKGKSLRRLLFNISLSRL